MSEQTRGPVESRSWPAEMPARAVSTTGTPRLFGYDVEGDLAAHYRFSDTMLLALTGELPDDARSRAFDAVMTFASAMSVAEAPIHASVLARTCGIRTGGTLAVGILSLGEHADDALRAIGAALDDAAASGELPAHLRASDDAERAAVAKLAELTHELDVAALRRDPSRVVAVVAVLRACGVVTPFQLGAALSVARLPSVIAETVATKVGDFKSYPMELPQFEYDAAAGPAGSRR